MCTETAETTIPSTVNELEEVNNLTILLLQLKKPYSESLALILVVLIFWKR